MERGEEAQRPKFMSSSLWIDVIGWIGVISLLLAYALVSARKVQGDSIIYHLMNLIGLSALYA